jgi:glycine cleavage system protein P-like pyridoxal-binding family
LLGPTPFDRLVQRADGTFFLDYDHPKSIGYIAPFYGNFGVIVMAYAYILALGGAGLKKLAEDAVLAARKPDLAEQEREILKEQRSHLFYTFFCCRSVYKM